MKKEKNYLEKFIEIFEKEESNFYFITGHAGTGKTTLLINLKEYFKKRKLNAVFTSSTGISATIFEGTTLNYYLGNLFYDQKEHFPIITGRNNRRWKIKAKQIKNTDILVIDEISMIKSDFFELINLLLQKGKGNNKIFGGIKIIMFGDFLQLPPIIKNWQNELLNEKWIFNSELWNKLDIKLIKLTKNFRQNDKVYLENLKKIRIGNFDEKVKNYFANFEDKKSKNIDQITKLVSNNLQAEKINNQNLEKLEGKEYFYKGTFLLSEGINENIIEEYKKELTIIPEKLILKIGAKVMSLINKKEDKIVNGSIGIITFLSKKEIKVKWLDQNETSVSFHNWTKVNEKGETICTFTQIPLKLCYAITIHKSQGMTLSELLIDCKNIFADGQLYTALSRIKDPKNMYILNFDQKYIKANREAIKFYEQGNWIEF
ncbi:/ / conjugal transfer relaxase TraA / 282462:283763 Reverse [Candidatus Hepatoplasma crinochetorum]|uniref:/ / conjugal transfer relaxase TraA / 282462:283763 Reverse n=1 Tax=Candidatus Hepatoplasma crinochetorum TaxID=295596 RepID=A0A0G7ZMZ3_9MOLU|nr:/ / conjugal transfer relaxase TraA / 282462:283763 Reverse [Candidatus Hepatoplasma crinochetorum]